MSKKYTYSRTYNGEVFTAVEFDSFDEAIKAVDRGIYERHLDVSEKMIKGPQPAVVGQMAGNPSPVKPLKDGGNNMMQKSSENK